MDDLVNVFNIPAHTDSNQLDSILVNISNRRLKAQGGKSTTRHKEVHESRRKVQLHNANHAGLVMLVA